MLLKTNIVQRNASLFCMYVAFNNSNSTLSVKDVRLGFLKVLNAVLHCFSHAANVLETQGTGKILLFACNSSNYICTKLETCQIT